MDKIFSINEASKIMCVSPSTVRRLCKSGKLDHYCYAGVSIIRLSESHIRKYLEKSQVYTPERRDAIIGKPGSLKYWKHEKELDVKSLFNEVCVKKCR